MWHSAPIGRVFTFQKGGALNYALAPGEEYLARRSDCEEKSEAATEEEPETAAENVAEPVAVDLRRCLIMRQQIVAADDRRLNAEEEPDVKENVRQVTDSENESPWTGCRAPTRRPTDHAQTIEKDRA